MFYVSTISLYGESVGLESCTGFQCISCTEQAPIP